MEEKRNMLLEAARIARGNVKPIEQCNVADFDAVVFPGGNGSAKNLFTYALEGQHCTVREDVAKVIRAFHAAGKPVGALCIAPVMIAKVLGNITITVGSDPGTIANVETFGTKHEITVQKGVCADKANKIFTTPCYMLPARISDIADCADNLVKEMLKVM
jgi:enhancing lycopene biosynthesis protein 2